MSSKLLQYRVFLGIFLGHFSLSLAGFFAVYGWGIAMQEAGAAASAAAWLELPLRIVLLQPVAHWVLAGPGIAWWTWPGLSATTLLLLLNSLMASALLVGCRAAFVLWRRRRQQDKIR